MKENYSFISEVFIGDPIDFRCDIFDCWLRGLAVEEALKKIKETSAKSRIGIDENESLDELIYEDILDSYRIFDFFKESLFVNSWNIVDFDVKEKQYMCEAYFALDENLIREIIAIGLGTRKRSILPTNKTIRKRTNEVLDGIKYMNEYIQTLDGQTALVDALHTRFNIRKSKAKCYLCLIFLLLDIKEGETIRNRPGMEWNLISTILWYFLVYWTRGAEVLSIPSVDKTIINILPVSLEFSPVFLESMKSIAETITKSMEKKNWQLKTDSNSLDQVVKRCCAIMYLFNEKKSKVRLFCEGVSSKLGQYYHNRSMSLNDVKENLQQCSQYMKNVVPEYSYFIDSFIEVCTLYLETFYSIHKVFYINQPKYFN